MSTYVLQYVHGMTGLTSGLKGLSSCTRRLSDGLFCCTMGGLLCCIAEGLEVVDIFAQPLANPTHIS